MHPQVLQGQEEEKTVLAVLLLVDFVITLVFRGFGALKPLPLAREDHSGAGGVWVFVCVWMCVCVCVCVCACRGVHVCAFVFSCYSFLWDGAQNSVLKSARRICVGVCACVHLRFHVIVSFELYPPQQGHNVGIYIYIHGGS